MRSHIAAKLVNSFSPSVVFSAYRRHSGRLSGVPIRTNAHVSTGRSRTRPTRLDCIARDTHLRRRGTARASHAPSARWARATHRHPSPIIAWKKTRERRWPRDAFHASRARAWDAAPRFFCPNRRWMASWRRFLAFVRCASRSRVASLVTARPHPIARRPVPTPGGELFG